MQKKLVGIAVVAAIAGAAYAGGCWYAGSLYDSNITAELAQINQQKGVKAEWLPGAHGLTRRDGVLQVTLQPEFFNQDPAAKPVELFFNVAQGLSPVSLKGEAQLDLTKGSIAPLLQQLQLKQIPHQLSWSYNVVTKGMTSDLQVDAWKLDSPEAKVDFAKLNIHSEGTFDSNANVTFSWEGVSASNGEQEQFYVAPAKGHTRLQKEGNAWFSPQSAFELAGFKFIAPDNSVTIDKLVSSGGISEAGADAERLELMSKLQVAKVQLQSAAFPLEIENLALDLKLSGVDKGSYLTLIEQGSQQKVDEAKAMAAAEQLLKKGLSLSLDNLSLSVNKAPLQAKGGLQLAANDKLQVNNIPFVISQLKGQLDLNAGKELVAMIPNGPQMLGPMVSAGFVNQATDGKLSVQLKLADGKTTANGQPLPLL